MPLLFDWQKEFRPIIRIMEKIRRYDKEEVFKSESFFSELMYLSNKISGISTISWCNLSIGQQISKIREGLESIFGLDIKEGKEPNWFLNLMHKKYMSIVNNWNEGGYLYAEFDDNQNIEVEITSTTIKFNGKEVNLLKKAKWEMEEFVEGLIVFLNKENIEDNIIHLSFANGINQIHRNGNVTTHGRQIFKSIIMVRDDSLKRFVYRDADKVQSLITKYGFEFTSNLSTSIDPNIQSIEKTKKVIY